MIGAGRVIEDMLCCAGPRELCALAAGLSRSQRKHNRQRRAKIQEAVSRLTYSPRPGGEEAEPIVTAVRRIPAVSAAFAPYPGGTDERLMSTQPGCGRGGGGGGGGPGLGLVMRSSS